MLSSRKNVLSLHKNSCTNADLELELEALVCSLSDLRPTKEYFFFVQRHSLPKSVRQLRVIILELGRHKQNISVANKRGPETSYYPAGSNYLARSSLLSVFPSMHTVCIKTDMTHMMHGRRSERHRSLPAPNHF